MNLINRIKPNKKIEDTIIIDYKISDKIPHKIPDKKMKLINQIKHDKKIEDTNIIHCNIPDKKIEYIESEVIDYKNSNISEQKMKRPYITIVKINCMIYIMNIIKEELVKMGWECSLIELNDVNYYIDSNNPYHYFLFLIPLQITDKVIDYKRYILYQLEQNINNEISVHYEQVNNLQKIYDNAVLLIDYCDTNINVTKNYYSNVFKLMNIPAKINNHYEYDIIFIGCVNERRENILNQLKLKYKVLIVENIYGEDLKTLCNKSNICLNIHFYENAILERVRLNEMMEYGIKIISEFPCKEDMDICKYYDSINFVEMIDVSNLDVLFETIEKIKDKKVTHNLDQLNLIFKKDLQIFEDICVLPKSVAIITANYGNYDKIKEINIKNKDFFDWYLFTDISINTTDYNVIHYPLIFDYAHNNDFNRLYAKYIKCQALNIDILKKYKYIIWQDSSLKFTNNNFVEDILNLLNKNKEDIYFYEHYYRNNIKDEYELSKTLSKYENNRMFEQLQKYEDEHFLDETLYECGIFIYKNNDKNIKLFNDWWKENINYSYQDQLSFPYVLWKHNRKPILLNDNEFIKKNTKGSVWDNKLFGIIQDHN